MLTSREIGGMLHVQRNQGQSPCSYSKRRGKGIKSYGGCKRYINRRDNQEHRREEPRISVHKRLLRLPTGVQRRLAQNTANPRSFHLPRVCKRLSLWPGEAKQAIAVVTGQVIANGIIAQHGRPWQVGHIYLLGEFVVRLIHKAKTEVIQIKSDRNSLLKELRERVKDQNYFYLDIDAANNNSLSLKARGIYGTIQYLQQHKGIDWPTINDLVGMARDGKDSLMTGMRELKKAGLIPLKPPLPQDRKPGFIYLFFSSDWGLHKIGLSSDVEFRRVSLQKKHKISIAFIDSIPSDDMGLDETLLHMHYADRRVKGEWFDLAGLDPMTVLRDAS